MAETMTLEQVVSLAAQLPLADQLKLVASIGERLSATLSAVPRGETAEDRTQKERLQLAEELLAEVEDIEDDSQGEFDSADTIQRMRQERAAQICQSGA